MSRIVILALLVGWSVMHPLSAATTAGESDPRYQLETIASGLNYPWCITFLPNGDYLLSLRSGELRRVSSTGTVSEPFTGTPESYVKSQGGYFDIALDPEFAQNKRIYLAYAFGTPKVNATRVMRATLQGNSLQNAAPIFTVSPSKDTPVHYGGKLLFLPDHTLLLTTGDGFQYRDAAQDTHNQLGKILRINRDGSLPVDNPFADGKQGDPAVWSYGHRNPQGLAYDSVTNTVIMHEHGPKGGDEINIIEPGVNYGWPAATFGVNYSGALVSPFTTVHGMRDPIKYWVPSIAPSGLAVYRGAAFPQWQGDLLVGALVDREVRRLVYEGGQIGEEQALFNEAGARIRDVRVGPDGFIYLLTDGKNGKLIRVIPTK